MSKSSAGARAELEMGYNGVCVRWMVCVVSVIMSECAGERSKGERVGVFVCFSFLQLGLAMGGRVRRGRRGHRGRRAEEASVRAPNNRCALDTHRPTNRRTDQHLPLRCVSCSGTERGRERHRDRQHIQTRATTAPRPRSLSRRDSPTIHTPPPTTQQCRRESQSAKHSRPTSTGCRQRRGQHWWPPSVDPPQARGTRGR